MSDEGERGSEANGAQHQEEGVADHEVVAEEEGGLHEPGHVGARQVVVEAIAQDE